MVEDARGILWATDGNGRLKRLADGRFEQAAELGQIATGPMLFKLTTDAAGGVWFFKQDTFGQIIEGRATNYSRLPGRVVNLAPSHDGGMWVSTGDDLQRMAAGQPGTLQMVRALNFGLYGIATLCEDRSGCLWIGSMREGLFRLRGDTLEKIEGVHHQITDIIEDEEGNIWVGTDGAGLFKVRPRSFQVLGVAEGLPQDTVVSVCEDWVAPRGGGLGLIDPSGVVKMLPEHADNTVLSIIEDGGGGAWLGTAGGRLIHRSAAGGVDQTLVVGPTGTQVRALHRDQADNLWIGAFPSGLFLLPAGNPQGLRNLEGGGFPKESVTALTEDAGGTVWIGTGAGRLYGHANGAFRSFGTNEGFTGFPIQALLTDSNKWIWVGTLGGGLGRFKNGQVQFVSRKHGLTEDVISQLVEDDAGWLWIGGSRGISRVRPGELEAVLEGRRQHVSTLSYGRSDGLVNVQCTSGSQPSVWTTRAGELRFATSRGVVSFNPAALPMNFRPPPLVLENVSVDGVPLRMQAEIRLPHDFKKLEFNYTALSFVAPEKLSFKRRLVGFDEEWIEVGPARTAAYPRLPPGPYAFQFTACNNDGVWNDEVSWLHFEVVPAYWQTAWFRTLVVVAFAGLVGGSALAGARMRMRRKLARLEQVNALERERTRISRDLHDDLGARLTQMTLLTDLAAEDSTTSGELKNQIKEVSAQARNAVQSLDETVWMINPQKDTLAHTVGYVAQYAEQFFRSTPVNCRQDIGRDLPECSMPGNLRRDLLMLVKESFNNALKHSGASEVRLRVAVRAGMLRISIRDNGKGFASGDAKAHAPARGCRRDQNVHSFAHWHGHAGGAATAAWRA
jgi:ligand-binding sensor domain-containing protein/two-component sensor histidine kinase